MLIACLPLQALAGAAPWEGKIRPGFMAGNSDVGTDVFLDVLLPVYGNEQQIVFFNPNFRFDDNDGNEQNLGFGFRQLSACGHYILGANAYYDTMESETGNRYQQWGLGAELLTEWFDLRANHYDVFGDTRNTLSGSSAGTGTYFFSGNSLFAAGGQNVEEALDGYDAEVSVLIPGLSDFMETRVAATYYRYDSGIGEDPDGWRGRLEFRPVKAIDLSVEHRDDDLRGTDTFVGGYLEIPFSLENLFAGKNPFDGQDLWSFGKGTRPLKERMTDKVVRDRHIVSVQNETGNGGKVAVVDDEIIFVNQDNEAEGDGSYENPYQSLDSAAADERFAPGAWIYVFSSDENADTYADTQFTLLDDMVFWGQGYAHPTYGLGGGANPILDGGGDGSVVTLADNNEVMGFTVQNGAEGIRGDNVLATNIHDNVIRENHTYTSGIHIENDWTPAEVNGLSLRYQFADNQILDNNGYGIYVQHYINGSAAVSDLAIENLFSNNTVQGNDGPGLAVRNNVRTEGDGAAVGNVQLVNRFIANTVGGDNEGEGNGSSGILSESTIYTQGTDSAISDTAIRHRFESNVVVGNAGTGIRDDYLYTITDGTNSGISRVDISSYLSDNEIRDNAYNGFQNESLEASTRGENSPISDTALSSEFTGNVISISQADASAIKFYGGLLLETTGTDSGMTNVGIENTFTGNSLYGSDSALDGISFGANGGSGPSMNIQVTDSTSPISGATIANTFDDNAISNFLGDGIHFPGLYIQAPTAEGLTVTDSSIANLVSNNAVTDNGGYGVYNWRNQIRGTVADSGLTDSYTSNDVSRNGDAGIYLDSDFSGGSNTSMAYSITNNVISDNGEQGLYMYIDPSNGALIDKTLFLQGNTIENNGSYGIELYVNGTSTDDFAGDFGGGLLNSTGGNTFADNGGYDIEHRGNSGMDVWALNNHWTDDADPESTIWDKQDSIGDGDIITALPPAGEL